ncbi:MAG: hypothetical protein ACWGQW_11125 [bacterium]
MIGCKHKWQIVFRDGPTDQTDWKCTKCGLLKCRRGLEPPEDEEKNNAEAVDYMKEVMET